MRTAAGLVALGLLAIAGCTGDPPSGEPASAPAAYTEVACPADVDAAVLAPITCGFLTVPENRADPDRTIRLFVTRVAPPERLHEDPVLVAGTNLGNAPNYGGIAPVAQRVGREAILLDARGVGHSEPSLACPEVESLQPSSLAASTTDPDTQRSFLAAVSECRDRLESEGIDLDSYTVDAMAADAEDLRRALGIELWNIHTYGTASRIALEMLRSHPEGIRAVFLDSPETEQVDPRAEGALALRRALSAVATRCRDDARCHRMFGDPGTTLDRALHRLGQRPQTVDLTDPATGESSSVYVDDAMLLRLLRGVLSDGGSSGSLYLPEAVPALVSLASERRLDEVAPLLTALVVEDTAYCYGYQPKCAPHMALSEGVYYSLMCRDPDVANDPARVDSTVGQQLGYADMFGDSPYGDLCSAWGEIPRRARSGDPDLESDVPALVYIGSFNSFTRPSTIREGLRRLSDATYVVNPRHGHNVLIGACLGEARLRWHETFTLTEGDLSCIEDRLPWKTEADLLRAAASAGG